MEEEFPCPDPWAVCLTYDEATEVEQLLNQTGAEYHIMEQDQAVGDVQAVADFTWQVLFLTPWELAYIALPMSVLAFYGLSIYWVFKKIQKKYS